MLELIAPTRCAGCDLPGAVLCERCRAATKSIDMRWACPRCGAPFGYLTCTECWNRELAFEAAIAVGVLERPLSRCITLYKDAGERRMAAELGLLLAQALLPWDGWGQCVVAIPASKAAVSRRGFDHADALAAVLARDLGIPQAHALSHARARDQRGLTRTERRANVASALVAIPEALLGGQVLLVDDVFTTGATLDAAAGVLMAAGAHEVRAAVLARAW